MHERSIFMEALGLSDPVARRAYILRACGGDERLRTRVEALLHSDRVAEGFVLDRMPPVDFPVPTEPAPLLVSRDTTIGPYRLMEQIGEGGMGVVYVAEQNHPVRRKVALKVIKPGMDSKQVVARFEAERQALAMMDHPNIARVFDGGATESGRPFFVMELVRGLSITEYCDRERLPIRERLDLLVLVCRAVQHAHQKGIIHRDLKPSNILVTLHDGVPVPKVIDFGIAKAIGQSLTEKTIYTAFTQLVGTPLYMSPEQVELSGLDVDTRSDIYSLGVLMYELLTGTTPFDSETLGKAAFDEIRRMIREEDHPAPSTRLDSLGADSSAVSANRRSDPRRLVQTMRGELDWIAMKAIEKDRTRRYATANDFAADVVRYLSDQPVMACPPSARYRFAKFVRRNRVALATGFALASTLIAGTAVSTWQAVRATRAERAIAAAMVEAHRERGRAEEHYRHARDAVERLVKRAAGDLADVPGIEQVRRALLEDALEFYRGSLKEKSRDRAIRHDIARSFKQVAMIYEALGERRRAEEPLKQAIVLLRDLSREFPAVPEFRMEEAACHDEMAMLRHWASGFDQSTSEKRAALELRQGLAADFPGRVDFARDLALSHVYLANSLMHRPEGRVDEAEAHYLRGRAIWREQEERFGEVPPDRAGLAMILHWWGNFLASTDRREEGADEYRKSLALREQLLAEKPTNPEWRERVGHICEYLGGISMELGKPEQAEGYYRHAIATCEPLLRDFPQVANYQRRLGLEYKGLGEALRALGRKPEAVESLRRCVAIRQKLVDNHPDTPLYSVGLGIVHEAFGRSLHELGRNDEAAASFRQSLGMFEGLAAGHPADPQFQQNVSWILSTCPVLRFRDPARAVELATRAVGLEPDAGVHRLTLGVALYRTGDWQGAAEALEKSLELSPNDDRARLFLAMALWRKGEKESARRCYNQAIQQLAKTRNPDAELTLFRTEAEELLSVDVKAGKN